MLNVNNQKETSVEDFLFSVEVVSVSRSEAETGIKFMYHDMIYLIV